MASDPSDIHPEYDALTPENADEWTEEQKEEYAKAKEAELTAEAERTRADLAAEERDTLEKLRSTTTTEQDTETVDLWANFEDMDETEVEVKTKLTGRIEAYFDAIAEEQGKEVPRTSVLKDNLIDAILALMVADPEPDDDPVTYQSRAFWEAFYYDHGTEGLGEVFDALAAPVMDRVEDLGNSRGRTRQSTSGR